MIYGARSQRFGYRRMFELLIKERPMLILRVLRSIWAPNAARRAAGATLLLLVVAIVSTAKVSVAQVTNIPLPNPGVGSSWTYSSSLGAASSKLIRIDKDSGGNAVFVVYFYDHEEYYSRNWNLMQIVGSNAVTFSPSGD
jgi:hypothetical protein